MVNNMCMEKPTTDWESRFKRAYDEFQEEKKRICSDYDKKIAEMKAIHAREIETMVARCVMYAEQALVHDKMLECSHVEIEGTRTSASYQDLIGILLNNGYGVEVQPIQHGDKLKITIKESEEK